MINSILQDESYLSIIKLRDYFSDRIEEIPGDIFRYEKPDYINLKSILDDIDAIILEKYKNDTNSLPNYNLYPSN